MSNYSNSNSNSSHPTVDSFLDSAPSAAASFLDEPSGTPESSLPEKQIKIVQLEEGEIDPRLKRLSHSSRTLLHKCPRKYQLYRLSSKELEGDAAKNAEQEVTFAYGHAVGIGIQSTLEGKSLDAIVLDTFLGWSTNLLDSNPRQNKSFWNALYAVLSFQHVRNEALLVDYELVYYKGKPAVELSFRITLPDGYSYRGFVDAVLCNTKTGEILVLECKTSSGNANGAQYKNSGQALGYSVILDKLFPELSSYTVLYLVYESKAHNYVPLPYQKSLLQRALWLQELLIDTHILSIYETYKVYPMQGHSCFDFFKECEYLGLCTLSTENLTKPLTEDMLEKMAEEDAGYDFTVSFQELVESQIDKIGAGTASTDTL